MRGLLLFFMGMIASCLMAQTPSDNWYFGEGLGLNFETQPPSLLFDGSQHSIRAVASISSLQGELLFYTEDTLIWNREHEIMPNGSGLFSNPYATQMATVPIANSSYALFTFDYSSNPPMPTSLAGLYYHVVDMTADGGLGDIDTTAKNIFVDDSLSSKIEAVPKCEGGGYWILARSAVSTEVYTYSIDPTTVFNSTAITANGFITPDSCCLKGGYIRCSPKGDLIVISHGHPATIEFFQFDRSTGSCNPLFYFDYDSTNYLPYGLEFSSSGEYLYCSLSGNGLGSQSLLLQFDVSQYDSTAISSSVDTIGTLYNGQGIQRGPDQRIYLTTDSFLSVINAPNLGGSSCDFEQNAIDLQGFLSGSGLPNYSFALLDNPVGNSTLCMGDTLHLEWSDSCFDALQWSILSDEGSVIHQTTSEILNFTFSDSGTYEVVFQLIRGTDTTFYTGETSVIYSLPTVLLQDSLTLCAGTSISVLNPVGFDLIWSTGSDSTSSIIDSTGHFFIDASNQCVDFRDSTFITTETPVNISFTDTHICQGHVLTLTTLVPSTLWSTGDTTSSIILDTSLSPNLDPVDIWLIASNACGSDSDTMTLSFFPLPDASLPPDSVQCFEAPVPVLRPDQDSTIYTWFDGSNDLSKMVTQDTTIWLIASNICGSDTDSMHIVFHPEIKVELGEDTFLCEGDSVVLNAAWPQATYNWTPGGSADSTLTVHYEDLQVMGEEIYVVAITEGPCTLVESRKISIQEEPCDSLACKFEIPNVFTPNGDGVNDVLRISNPCTDIAFRMSIYNRWGQLVFFGNSNFNQWDGSVNGQPAADGTYFVVVEADGVSVQRNSVTLIRE